MRLIRIPVLLPLCLLLFHSSFSHAASEPPVTVKAEINRAFITIGDPVEYTVTIRHAPSVEILSSLPPPVSDALKIQKVEDIKRKDGAMIIEGRRFHLTAFRLGDFIIDPVEIQYRNKQTGGDVKKLQTTRLFLSVQSVDGAKEKTDIRGIKSVIALASRAAAIWIGLALLAILAVAVIIYRRFAKKVVPAPANQTLLTPDQEALLQLNELFDSDLLRRGKIKEYYLKLSEILRTYFEKRYEVLAVESTTCEVLNLLRAAEISTALLQKIDEVLSAADLAKFAKWKPEPSEIIHLNKRSQQIVEESRPQTAEGPSADGLNHRPEEA